MTKTKVMAIINPAISHDDEIQLAKKLMDNYPIAFLIYRDVKELFPVLSGPNRIDYVAVDLVALHSLKNVDVFAVLNTLSTLLACSDSSNAGQAKIVILVGPTTPPELIKEVMGLPTVSFIGLRGGDGFTYEEIGASLAAILANDNTIPQQVQNMLSKRRKTGKSGNAINLTPRQRQIFNLVASANELVRAKNELKQKEVEVKTAEAEARRMAALANNSAQSVQFMQAQAMLNISEGIKAGKVQTIVVPANFNALMMPK